ncbi:LOG family protein [Patescibacteria group bacterium]|nr:LOG family protein [Patescibacteria group bacterium]MBU0777398.1 LOG family protein [Patescibacteria group bacterium]MBU0846034.1 LOG family protein [Patescibacteria group bacterium]MBU0922466.1 LOG family protein [Patescibacteria group bacterium]MBU1066801.1 LOG family protein [Patescibacteria group bacterium]
MKKIKQVSYFGFADAAPNDPLYKEAYECAKFLTEKGLVAINGGGPGVMRAVSEGAKAAGGRAIGVTFYPEDITNYEGRDPENPMDEEVEAKNYLERTMKLLELGDAYVIFRGGTGTISEFGMAWGLARLYFGHHKPLILYGEFWNEIIKDFKKNMRIRPEDLKVYKVVKTPLEAYEAIEIFEDALKKQNNIHDREKAFQL